MAARAGKLLVTDEFLVHRMARLFVELETDIPVAGKTKVRFFGRQQLFNSLVDRVAAVTRIAGHLVSIHIPECQRLCFFVAGQAFGRPCSWVALPAEG
jgi:hypothetical protein